MSQHDDEEIARLEEDILKNEKRLAYLRKRKRVRPELKGPEPENRDPQNLNTR